MGKNRIAPKCGGCGAEDATPDGAPEANPGDGYVCAQCGWIGVFDGAMQLEKMTEAQLAALPPIVRFVVLETSRAIRAGTLKP